MSAVPRASNFTGRVIDWPLPTWVSVSLSGNAFAAGTANPLPVRVRTKCFIASVSPARSRLRSSTLCAMSGAQVSADGSAKRQDSMPSFHEVSVKVRSRSTRADTNQPPGQFLHDGAVPRLFAMRARPCVSDAPVQTGLPSQVLTVTCAPATGSPVSSAVTHTSEDSRPILACATRLVTSAAVCVWNADLPSR